MAGTRLFSRRLIEFVTRNHTADMIDTGMGMPMHRGLGVHVRGTTETIRGLGSLASPRTFGHGGAYRTYGWVDPAKDIVGVIMLQRTNGGGDVADEINSFMAMAGAAIER